MQILSGKWRVDTFLSLFLLVFSTFNAPAAPGDFDTTFGGGDGILVSDIGSEDRGLAMVLQADGKILVAGRSRLSGNSYPDLVVVRYNADGSFDQSFGSGGVARNNVNNISLLPEINALTLQPDGKIVAVCSFRTTNGTLTKSGVLRYNTNGSLDGTFGSGGIVVIEAAVDRAVVLQPDGKIISGGGNGTSLTTDFQISRLNPNGSPDTSFDTDGILRIDFNGGGDGIFGLALQPDGKIVAVGRTYSSPTDGTRDNYAVARILTNGTLDMSFGTGGKVVTDFANLDDLAYAVTLQPDGKIIVSGQAAPNVNNLDFGLVRYNADGSLDTTFGNGGRVLTDFDGLDTAFTVKLQRNGKIIAAGRSLPAAAVARYNANGSLDTGFGSGGKVFFYFNANDEIRGLDIRQDGKIVVAGTADGGAIIGKIAVARLIGDVASLSTKRFDFDGDGRADVSIYRAGTWHLLNSLSGYTAFQFGLNSDKIVPADYDGDGKTDAAVYRDGVWYILQSNANQAQIVQFGLSGDIPQTGDYDGDGKTDLAVFRPSDRVWYLLKSTNGFSAIQFGLSDDKPVAADYDGDGKTDIAIFRPDSGQWWIQRSSNGAIYALQFGETSDYIVPADYTGDGKSDIALFRPSNGFWYILRSEDNSFYGFPFGASGDIPASADYDGDGKTDPAVFRNGVWYLQQSTNGVLIQQFGVSGDIPVASAFVR